MRLTSYTHEYPGDRNGTHFLCDVRVFLQELSSRKAVNIIYISIMDKTPTHALFTQHYNSLAC